MDRQLLAVFLEEGLSLEEIGRRIGRHPSTVSYWLKKHGLEAVNRHRHLAKGGVERSVLAALVERGMTIRQIADELEASDGFVRYWLVRYNVSTVRAKTCRPINAEGHLPRRVTRRCRNHGDTEFVLEGRGYYRCARCRQQRVADRRRRVKAKLVAEMGGCCRICGYDRFPGALEFHHIDPAEKAFGVSARGMTLGIARLREEAAKCVLLCSNCHAEVEGGLTRYPDD